MLSVCMRWMKVAQKTASDALCFTRGIMLLAEARNWVEGMPSRSISKN